MYFNMRGILNAYVFAVFEYRAIPGKISLNYLHYISQIPNQQYFVSKNFDSNKRVILG